MIGRDAFLYLEPDDDTENFAQCETCRFQTDGQCAVIGVDVDPGDSCGVYLPPSEEGDPEPIGESISKEDAGFVSRPVRCENCAYFDAPAECELFDALNKAFPQVFDLETQVMAHGCCNAQTPKRASAGGFAVLKEAS